MQLAEIPKGLSSLRATACVVVLALASTVSQAAGWTGRIKVVGVFTEATTDNVVFYTTGGSVYATGCAANAWFFMGNTDAKL
jgi:hypothetical protein